MDTKTMSQVPSLSCVENYFLSWLSELGCPLNTLYNQSFVPFNAVIDELFSKGISFTEFDGIPRVQTTAESFGMVSHDFYKDDSVLNILDVLTDNSLMLISVNVEFFRKISRRPWRDDHYISIEKKNKRECIYFNNYPLEAGTLPRRKISKVFDGNIIVFHRTSEFDSVKSKQADKDQIARIIIAGESCPVKGLTQDKLVDLRDAIGIIRVRNRRMKEWLLSTEVCGCNKKLEKAFVAATKKLDKLFAYIEIQYARGKFDIEGTEQLLNQCISDDNNLMAAIKDEIRI